MRTLQEIENCGKECLVPTDVAKYLGVQPYSINCAARNNPDGLRFPFTLIGSRVVIPREGFVRWAKATMEEKRW